MIWTFDEFLKMSCKSVLRTIAGKLPGSTAAQRAQSNCLWPTLLETNSSHTFPYTCQDLFVAAILSESQVKVLLATAGVQESLSFAPELANAQTAAISCCRKREV